MPSFCRKGKNRYDGVAIFAKWGMNVRVIDVSHFRHAESCALKIVNSACFLLVVYRSSTSGDVNFFKWPM